MVLSRLRPRRTSTRCTVAGEMVIPSRASSPLIRSGPNLVVLRSYSMRSSSCSLVWFGERAGREDRSSSPASPKSS